MACFHTHTLLVSLRLIYSQISINSAPCHQSLYCPSLETDARSGVSSVPFDPQSGRFGSSDVFFVVFFLRGAPKTFNVLLMLQQLIYSVFNIVQKNMKSERMYLWWQIMEQFIFHHRPPPRVVTGI